MGRSHTTAFRLSGIRARGDAAESDVAMASNDNKKKARRLQQENPGMKYTEALRRVEAGDESFDPALSLRFPMVPSDKALEHLRKIGEHLGPDGSDEDALSLEWDPKSGEVVVLNKAHRTDASQKESRETLEELLRQGRTNTEGTEQVGDEGGEKTARWLQRVNPGMSHAEALRIAKQEAPSGHVQAVDEWAVVNTALRRKHLDRMIRQSRRSSDRRDILKALPVQSLSDIVDRLDVGGRAPWPVQAGDYTDDWTPAVLYPLEDTGNLAVCGNALAGHTTFLRSLADSAAAQGWAVTVMGGKGDEYKSLRERHPRKVGTLPGGVFLSEAEVEAFYAQMRPGTAKEPRLLIVDNGSYFFEATGEREGEPEWVGHLEALMTDPYTAVVVQVSRLASIPARLRERFGSRVLLGHSPRAAQESVFGDVVPREVLGSFDFDQPAWTKTVADRGRGVLWDGRELRPLRTAARLGE